MALSEIISTIEDIKRDIQNQQKQINLFKKSNQNNISLKKAETALQQAEKSATQAARI